MTRPDPAADHELVGHGGVLVGVERVPAVREQVAVLRGADDHEGQQVAVDDRDRHRVDPGRGAVPDGGQQPPSAGALEEAARRGGELGLGGCEGGPVVQWPTGIGGMDTAVLAETVAKPSSRVSSPRMAAMTPKTARMTPSDAG